MISAQFDMPARRPVQLALTPRRPNRAHPTWGGARQGAGRPKAKRDFVRHRPRSEHQARHPVHATLRFSAELGQLRTKKKLQALKAAIRGVHRRRQDYRVVHYALMSTHLHLIVEADDKHALTNGMRALGIALAHRLNAVMKRRGAVLAERYHARALRTPRETRHALAYVLLNHRHHKPNTPAEWIDPCSSGAAFTGWTRRCALPPGYEGDDPPPVAAPTAWLLRVGWWKYCPRISPSEVPGQR
jgi:REP element-mobilizing transposase RayT